eukprot:9502331-Pyramimonas_sp.AAC.1
MVTRRLQQAMAAEPAPLHTTLISSMRFFTTTSEFFTVSPVCTRRTQPEHVEGQFSIAISTYEPKKVLVASSPASGTASARGPLGLVSGGLWGAECTLAVIGKGGP